MTPSTLAPSETTSGVAPSVAAQSLHVGLDRVGGALADLAAVQVDAAHAGLRRERDEGRAHLLHLALADTVLLLGQDHDAATLGRLVRQRRELRGVGERRLRHAVGRHERGGLTVTERDRARLVEQQHVDVAGCLDGPPGHGDHVLLDHAIHAGDADRGEERANRRRDQAHQQRDQHGHGDRAPLARGADAVERKRKQRRRRQQEDDRHRCQQDVERDLVRRLLTLGALDQRDHAIEERLTRIRGDLDDEPVRQHLRAAGDRAAVAAALADHRGALAGDRGFVHRRDALDHGAVGGDELTGLDQHVLPLAQARRRDQLESSASLGLRQPPGLQIASRLAQRRRLRLAAPFGHRLGEVREQHGEPEPHGDPEDEPRRRLTLTDHRLPPQERGQDGAHVHDEHHGVPRLAPRRQLAEGVDDRLPDDRRIEQ
jgi:hypothetical protein